MLAWLGFTTGTGFARDPEAMRIPLEPLGYQTTVPEFLLQGSSGMTVHFVDDTHLLVTFGVRRLMKRDEVPSPDHEDRTVGAFLVELPTGKVLAKTEWRLHDRGQYLWALGHGRFVLRVQDRLTLLEPLTAKEPAGAFAEYPFLRFDRRVVALMVSAEGDLLTLETADRPAPGEKVRLGAAAAGEGAPVQINFYRLLHERAGPQGLKVANAGVLRARTALALPVTTGGFLDVLAGGRDRWLFNFDVHGGKVMELAEFSTSCFPRITFVSRSEFVAFGCRGGSDKGNLAGFDLKGDALWQQGFFDSYVAPVFDFASAVGRFALERTVVSSAADPASPFAALNITGQEVRVYMAHTGRLLLKAACTPVERAGQNMALSPDGLRLAVMQETLTQHKATKDFEAYTTKSEAVVIYALPSLTSKEEAAVKEELAQAPADAGARIDVSLKRISAPSADEAAEEATTVAEDPAPAAPAADAGQQKTGTGLALGDEQPTGPRKPPTLYGPGEAPPLKKPQ